MIWGANPLFAARLTQPLKGAVLLMVTAAAAIVLAPAIVRVIGEGVVPPGPIPTHFAIVAVVFTFWLAIGMGGWPLLAAIKRPVPAGLAVLVSAYLVTAGIFRLFVDYEFLRGTPLCLESAPQGA